MPKIAIIADDLTGANATSSLLAREGFKSATFLDIKKYVAEDYQSLDVVSINTDSRSIKKDIAYKRVGEVVNFFKREDIGLFVKRIDSTLRGNIGAEIDGVLDNVSEDTVAVVVPAFPKSGRVCIGGYLMVEQVPLENTDVSVDPKTPVTTSKVSYIIKRQTKKKIGFIELGNVLKGVDYIKDALINEVKNGCRIIVVDATTNEDIERIAKAVKESKIKVISVDPGPFTHALSKELLEEPEVELGQKLMVTVGSVSELTRKQLDEFILERSPFIVEVDVEKLIYTQTSNEEISRVVNILLKQINNYNVIGVTTNSSKKVLDLNKISNELDITEDDVSQRIAKGLAKINKRVIDSSNSIIGGLYTSGGDITVAVCKELEATGIKVKDQVIPLAVYGRLLGGRYHDIAIITKGGLVGDEKAMIKCIDYILTKLSNEYYTKIM